MTIKRSQGDAEEEKTETKERLEEKKRECKELRARLKEIDAEKVKLQSQFETLAE